MMELSKWILVFNLFLVVSLSFVYLKNLVKFKSSFTFGLFIFSFLFLIQNAVLLYFFITMMPYYAAGVEVYAFVFSVVQTVAFLVLNFITWR